MHQQLLRHFQESPFNHSQLYLRILCCLSLVLPAAASLTVGRKTKMHSDLYFLRTTPADYFFRIWILIFLGITIQAIWVAIVDGWAPTLWLLFAAVNLLATGWAFAFNSGTKIGLALSVFLQLTMTVVNEFLWIFQKNAEESAFTQKWEGCVWRNITAFHQGWLIAASALGLCLILVHILGMSHSNQVVLFWIAAPLVYSGVIVINGVVIGKWVDTLGLLASMAWAVLGAGKASFRDMKDLPIAK